MTFLNFLEFSGLGVLTPARASGPHPPGVLRAQNGVDKGPIGPYGTGKRGAINYRKLNSINFKITIDIIVLVWYTVSVNQRGPAQGPRHERRYAQLRDERPRSYDLSEISK